MFRKLLGNSIFVISTVLSLILNVTVSAMATTGEVGQVRHFAVSPNGEEILFVSELSTATDRSWADVMVYDFTTEQVIGLTGDIKEIGVSPDEKFIAYVETDSYYNHTVSLMTADGSQVIGHHHKTNLKHFSQLRWSREQQYLSFLSEGYGNHKETVVISAQVGIVPDKLATLEWQVSKPLPADHPLRQKKPSVRADSTVLWGNDQTIYVQVADGIWKGSLDVPFIVQWTQLVAAEDLTGYATTNEITDYQAFRMSSTRTHLLYRRANPQPNKYPDIWVLPLEAGATAVKVGSGQRAQFTPDGQHVLLSNIGLWMVSLDGSFKRKLTRQKSLP